jgi:hypothetical protein
LLRALEVPDAQPHIVVVDEAVDHDADDEDTFEVAIHVIAPCSDEQLHPSAVIL